MTTHKKFWYYAFAFVGVTFMLFSSFEKDDEEEVTGPVDADGNVYSTIVIGDQEWMAENLKTTHYNDGTPIPYVSGDSDWASLTTGASTWHANDEVKNAYGVLYNGYAVETGNLCPAGWHVPTFAEWTTLINYAGGAGAGGKLKSTRTEPDARPAWDSPNTGATDAYGFSAFPGGLRDGSGIFNYVDTGGYWWTSTESDATTALYKGMFYTSGDVNSISSSKRRGLSVRCLRD